jgi:uncharacterized protein (DUF1778 family)
MTRDDAARWYDEHRDSLVDWTEDAPDAPPTPKRRRGAMISARFSQEEVALLRVAAEARGLSLSALVRTAALRFAAAAPEEAPTLTAADVRTIVREELAADRAKRAGRPTVERRPRTA